MIIRRAGLKDIDSVGELLKSAQADSPTYSNKPIAELRTKALLHNVISNPKGIVLVDEGFNSVLIGEVTPNWLTSGWVAMINLIYTKPGTNGLRVIREFKRWAKGWPQVTNWQASTSYGGERAEAAVRVLTKMGMTPIGTLLKGDL